MIINQSESYEVSLKCGEWYTGGMLLAALQALYRRVRAPACTFYRVYCVYYELFIVRALASVCDAYVI